MQQQRDACRRKRVHDAGDGVPRPPLHEKHGRDLCFHAVRVNMEVGCLAATVAMVPLDVLSTIVHASTNVSPSLPRREAGQSVR